MEFWYSIIKILKSQFVWKNLKWSKYLYHPTSPQLQPNFVKNPVTSRLVGWMRCELCQLETTEMLDICLDQPSNIESSIMWGHHWAHHIKCNYLGLLSLSSDEETKMCTGWDHTVNGKFLLGWWAVQKVRAIPIAQNVCSLLQDSVQECIVTTGGLSPFFALAKWGSPV